MKAFQLLLPPFLLITLSACASTAAITKQAQASRNAEQLIGEYGYWKRNCSNRDFDIFIEKYPIGGELRFEVGTLTIPDDPEVGSAGSCVGQSVASKRLVYVPNNNFVGTDSITYRVKSSLFLASKTYEIDIDVN